MTRATHVPRGGVWFATPHVTIWLGYFGTLCYLLPKGDNRYRSRPPPAGKCLRLEDDKLAGLFCDLYYGAGVKGIIADRLDEYHGHVLRKAWPWLDLPGHLRAYTLKSLANGQEVSR